MGREQPIEIRPYETSDHDFVVQLSEGAFGEYAHAPVAHISATLREPATSAVVAVAGERVGFAVLRAGKRIAYLQAIAVIETHRGRGIGRALLGAVERMARGQGALGLELATSQSNLHALELFLNHGFAIVARKARYYQRGQDAVILAKQL